MLKHCNIGVAMGNSTEEVKQIADYINSFDDFNQWFQPGGVLYGFLPLYHIFGFAAGFLAPLHFGMGILLQSTIISRERSSGDVKSMS